MQNLEESQEKLQFKTYEKMKKKNDPETVKNHNRSITRINNRNQKIKKKSNKRGWKREKGGGACEGEELVKGQVL